MAKEERVDLIKKVYSKTEYPKVIDTKFSELGITSLTNEIDNTFTVADFFEKYNGAGKANIETTGLVSDWTFYFQRSDINLRNEWSNYSNYVYNSNYLDEYIYER